MLIAPAVPSLLPGCTFLRALPPLPTRDGRHLSAALHPAVDACISCPWTHTPPKVVPTLTYDSGESTCFQLNVRHLFTSTPYSHDQRTSQNGEKRAPSQEISPGHSELRSTQAAGTCLDLVGWSLRAEPRLRRVRRKRADPHPGPAGSENKLFIPPRPGPLLSGERAPKSLLEVPSSPGEPVLHGEDGGQKSRAPGGCGRSVDHRGAFPGHSLLSPFSLFSATHNPVKFPSRHSPGVCGKSSELSC